MSWDDVLRMKCVRTPTHTAASGGHIVKYTGNRSHKVSFSTYPQQAGEGVEEEGGGGQTVR